MKILNNIKHKSFRKSKKDPNPATTHVESPPTSVQTPAMASASHKETSPSPSPVKSPQITQTDSRDHDNTQEESLRPLRLGSFAFSSSYVFPSLYSEAVAMLDLSLLIYTLSELRDLARNGVLTSPEKSLRILQTPLPLETAMEITRGESELLTEVLSDGKHDATLYALRSLMNKKKEEKVKASTESVASIDSKEGGNDQGIFSNFMDSWNGCLAGGFSFDEVFCGNLSNVDNGRAEEQSDSADSSIIYTVGDEKSFEECVYAIELNNIEERVTVVFRGSVTKADFSADSNVDLMNVPEPSLDTKASDDSTIGIHEGYYEYLFSKKNKQSKFDQIMNQVKKLFRQDPNRQRHYKLYITGHGLGGALATLFGYYCAALYPKHELPVPITIVSVASPRVGNLAFARSFMELESQAKLRHLRIAACKDPMTLGPIHSSKRPLVMESKMISPLCSSVISGDTNDNDGPSEVYFHTGIVMKLRQDIPATTSQRCEMSYSGQCVSESPTKCTTQDKQDVDSLIREYNKSNKSIGLHAIMAKYHYGMAYAQLLALVETDLSGLSLNMVYREKGERLSL